MREEEQRLKLRMVAEGSFQGGYFEKQLCIPVSNAADTIVLPCPLHTL